MDHLLFARFRWEELGLKPVQTFIRNAANRDQSLQIQIKLGIVEKE